MTAAVFATPANWDGLGWELGIEYGPVGDAYMRCALEALWSHPRIQGPWEKPADVAGNMGTRGLPANLQNLCGLMTADPERTLGCSSLWLRGEYYDRLHFTVPGDVISDAFPNLHTTYEGDDIWIRKINGVFISVAARIHAIAPFNFAAISGDTFDVTSASLRPSTCKRHGLLLPESLFRELAPDCPSRRLAGGLVAVGFSEGFDPEAMKGLSI